MGGNLGGTAHRFLRDNVMVHNVKKNETMVLYGFEAMINDPGERSCVILHMALKPWKKSVEM